MKIVRYGLALGNGAYPAAPGRPPSWNTELERHWDEVSVALSSKRIFRVVSVGGARVVNVNSVRIRMPPEASSTEYLLRERYDYHVKAMGLQDALPPIDLTPIDRGVNAWQNLVYGLRHIERETRVGLQNKTLKVEIVIYVNWSQAWKVRLWLPLLTRKILGQRIKTEVVAILSYDHKAWTERLISTFEGLVGFIPAYQRTMERGTEDYSSPVGRRFAWIMLNIFRKHV